MPTPVLVKLPMAAGPPGWPLAVPSAITVLMVRSEPPEMVETEPAPATVLKVTLLPSRSTKPLKALPPTLLIWAVVALALTVTIIVPPSPLGKIVRSII